MLLYPYHRWGQFEHDYIYSRVKVHDYLEITRESAIHIIKEKR